MCDISATPAGLGGMCAHCINVPALSCLSLHAAYTRQASGKTESRDRRPNQRLPPKSLNHRPEPATHADTSTHHPFPSLGKSVTSSKLSLRQLVSPRLPSTHMPNIPLGALHVTFSRSQISPMPLERSSMTLTLTVRR